MPKANNVVNSPAEEPNLNTAEGLSGWSVATALKKENDDNIRQIR